MNTSIRSLAVFLFVSGFAAASPGCGDSRSGESNRADAGAGAGAGAGTDSGAGADADASADSGPDAVGPDTVDAAGPFVSATVVVQRATSGGTIGPGFAGLSYEKAHVSQTFFTAANAPLIGLFGLLGTSVLRIGGNTVDQTTWTPAGAGHTAGQTAKPDVDALAAFAKATGWSVIYGLNMKTSNATTAADEAAYAASALGSSLFASSSEMRWIFTRRRRWSRRGRTPTSRSSGRPSPRRFARAYRAPPSTARRAPTSTA